MRLLVVGGNGFLGSAIVKQAVSRQWEVISISKRGTPFITPAGHQPAWSASPKITWKAGDALLPETYADVVKSCDAVVHTVGILLESQYKGETGGGVSQVWQGLKRGWGLADGQGNPLKQENQEEGGMTYEKMNRDSALTVAKTFSSTRTLGDLAPFVYISAEDIFRPIISSRYIDTKRQAEDGIYEIAQEEKKLKPVFLRPGLMYHPQTRPLSTLPAAALDLSSWVHQLSAKTNLPLPTPARLLSLFPGADLSALSRLLTTTPLHVDTVAKAACEVIVQSDTQGPIGVEDIRRLARLNTSTVTSPTKPSSSPPWPSQNMDASTIGQRNFSTSARSIRQDRQEQHNSEETSKSAVSISGVAAALALLLALQHMTRHPLQNESASMTQQELMRARANMQGVYAWGSNRYNVVAPDSPLTTFVKTPRSIPYFDGMALRALSLEERHGVAVDANGDVLQWGLGFFDNSLESKIQENLDDVPLGRRREKEKANELTPRGSLGAQPLAPIRTLVGKDIVKLATSDTKIYALSKKGKVYVFSAVQARQWPGKSPGWSLNPLTLFGFLAKSNIDHEELRPLPSAKFGRGERIEDIQAGSHHVLALSNKGRTFSAPIDTDGNAYGQLGTRRIVLGVRQNLIEIVMEARMLTEVEQKPTFRQTQVLPAWALPPGFDKESQTNKPVTGPTNRGIYVRTRTNANDQSSEARDEVIAPASNIRYCTTLHEIPTLKGLEVAQIASGSDHSIARTKRGQVLGWGRQTHGQTGLGAQIALEAVPVPTEVVLARAFANTSVDIHCTDVNAGADNTFFTMSRREPGGVGTGHRIDVLAVGKGQWGSLGNAMWSQVTLTPVKVKTISGLIEYSERTGTTHPVPIHTISVGKPGSIALVLDTVEHEGHQAFGRDVMVFGHNAAYQLGTSKRSNLCIPQHLQPLPPQTPEEGAQAPLPLLQASKLIEEDLNSGVLTHMPHKRLQLVSLTKQDTKTAGKSLNIEEKRGTKRNVEIEESIIAGAVSMAVYWKVHV